MPIDPTPLSDYAHWNEDARYMWYEEVGKHASTQAEEDPYDYYEEDYEEE